MLAHQFGRVIAVGESVEALCQFAIGLGAAALEPVARGFHLRTIRKAGAVRDRGAEKGTVPPRAAARWASRYLRVLPCSTPQNWQLALQFSSLRQPLSGFV